jgi:hypothetical protein
MSTAVLPSSSWKAGAGKVWLTRRCYPRYWNDGGRPLRPESLTTCNPGCAGPTDASARFSRA